MLLVDTGRVPIESQGSTLEFGMIDDARLFEHSGPALALFRWSSTMKQFLLYVVFLNVLVVPWGLAERPQRRRGRGRARLAAGEDDRARAW